MRQFLRPLAAGAALALLFGATVRKASASPAAGVYPRIPALSSADPVFSQYCDDVLAARHALASAKGNRPIPLSFYSYAVRREDSLIGIAARCSVPYDAIASLNRISSSGEAIAGRILLLPTLPGLYLPDSANSNFERMLLSSFDPDNPAIVSFRIRDAGPGGGQRTVHCIPDASFDGTLRACFLTPVFRFPLPEAVVTSSFGMRKNPVSGKLLFHRGIDLAAPRGTEVRAFADGTVTSCGFDPVYGNYVIVRHEGNRESLYGHLQTIKIELHQKVKSATILGTVGSTGQSTGPHLHFEIHENGVPKNPAGFIKGNSPV